MTFGEEVHRIRKRKNLSLKEVAKRGEISHSYISQIENTHRNPPKPEVIKRLSKGIGESYIRLMILAGYLNEDEMKEYCRYIL